VVVVLDMFRKGRVLRILVGDISGRKAELEITRRGEEVI